MIKENILFFLFYFAKKTNKKRRKLYQMRILSRIIGFTAILFLVLPHLMKANGIIKFDKTTYGAASQNWSVSSDSQGTIYFANHNGLLEFDGTTWQLYQLPNKSILRSVKVYSDSLIFTSGYMELGYWKPDQYGSLQYFSLNSKAKKHFKQNIEFWNIVSSKETVFFQSYIGILAYNKDSITSIPLKGLASTINNVNEKILVAIIDDGIYEVSENELIPYIKTNFFTDKLIRFILPYKNNQILIGTASNGVFIWDGKGFREWKPDYQNYFIKNELNRGYYSEKGELILGTIIDGIIVFDKNEKELKRVNAKNGLPNNTVLGIETDNWGNIWLALDNGIGFVTKHPHKSFSIEEISGIGAIYSLAIFNERLYLGTNQGLYLKEQNGSYSLLPETLGQVWDCKVINNKLWINHNKGTFLIEDKKPRLISDNSGGFSLTQDIHSGKLIQSTYTDLITFETGKDKLVKWKGIEDFYNLIRFLEIDHLGNIWASHMHLGVFKVETDDNRTKAIKTTYFGENTFGQNHSINVFKVENRIVFTTRNKIFTYDDLKDTIINYKQLNDQLGKHCSAHRIISAPNHHYWFISKNNIGLFQFSNEKYSLVKDYPVTLFSNSSLIDKYENILPIEEKTALLCLQNGIARLNAAHIDSSYLFHQIKPRVREIKMETNKGKMIHVSVNSNNLSIKFNYNNLFIRVAFPQLNELPYTYKYLLVGLNQEWSDNLTEPGFEFKRLPKGQYNLIIKAVDSWGKESKTTQIKFEILPPWYLSKLAYTIYVIFLIFSLFLFRFNIVKQTRKKEQHEREKKEKELIKLRNEKLQSEISHKSKELANSTMAIIRKNELLIDLKQSIEKQKMELGTRFPDKYFNQLNKKIDNNITSQDDWQVFETNFERAHEQFFTKIKISFPELTSSDLRLCAFLRMNLSSKEIAPLLGISVRGIENHRYRLRKKFNLNHDESLTDTIFSF